MQSQMRRQYTEVCKHEAVRLITDQGYGGTEAARNLGINAHMLGRWKRQSAQQKPAVKGNGYLSAAHEALLRLRKENPRLRMERDILKKTVRFFASASSCNTPALRKTRSAGQSQFCVRCWGVGAGGFMTTKSVRRHPPSVAKRLTCVSVSRRYRKRRITGMAVVAWPRPFRTRGLAWVASRCVD